MQLEPFEREEIDCWVVVVTYNSSREIGSMLNSIPAAGDGLRLGVIVVDNASTDDTLTVVGQFPGIRCISAGANLGYSGAINIAREIIQSRACVLVLNPDLELGTASIRELHEALRAPGVGMTVPTIVNPDGTRFASLRREPSVLRALGDAVLGKRAHLLPACMTERIWGDVGDNEEIAWAGGAALMIDAVCDSEVGRWDDTRFFLYSEETDYAARVRDAGYRIEYVEAAQVRHLGGSSGSSADLVALAAVNRLRYYEMRNSRFSTILFRVVILFGEVIRSKDLGHRRAARMLLLRSQWSRLPGGRRD